MSQLVGKSVEDGVKFCIQQFPIFSKKRQSGSIKLACFYINYMGMTKIEELFACPKDFEPESVLRQFRYQLNPSLKNYDQERNYREAYGQNL